ncbi:MAG: hypothetical protein R3242_05740 [Akkermansiaceae bacterium]|nr:hypothetical protein [Akkermansiaceae bacterium]
MDELIHRASHLLEGGFVTILHVTFDFDDVADLLSFSVHQHAFDGASSNVETGKILTHRYLVWVRVALDGYQLNKQRASKASRADSGGEARNDKKTYKTSLKILYFS